jgi:hypothetical protein
MVKPKAPGDIGPEEELRPPIKKRRHLPWDKTPPLETPQQPQQPNPLQEPSRQPARPQEAPRQPATRQESPRQPTPSQSIPVRSGRPPPQVPVAAAAPVDDSDLKPQGPREQAMYDKAYRLGCDIAMFKHKEKLKEAEETGYKKGKLQGQGSDSTSRKDLINIIFDEGHRAGLLEAARTGSMSAADIQLRIDAARAEGLRVRKSTAITNARADGLTEGYANGYYKGSAEG